MKDIRKYWDHMAKFGPDASVIDPNDQKGYKNKYIASLRDRAILNVLEDKSTPAIVLDFGCGSGNLSKTLSRNGYWVAGVDISFNLLSYAHRHKFNNHNLFTQYDGERLPFSSNSIDACAIYGVLIYFRDDALFCKTLKEIKRVLKPNGRLVAIEQTRRTATWNPSEMKSQRSADEVLKLLEKSGFHNKENRIIRRGHFPLIYAIRYGLVPQILFQQICKAEELIGKVFKKPLLDYVDTLFVSEKL